MKHTIFIIPTLCSFLFASNDLYTDDYFFKQQVYQTNLKSTCNNSNKPTISHESTNTAKIDDDIKVDKKEYKQRTKKHHYKRRKNNKCDVVKAMLNKTYYNPSQNVFYINRVEYSELPKEFRDCNITFKGVSRDKRKITFSLSNNEIITGSISIPESELDENFFYSGNQRETSKQTKNFMLQSSQAELPLVKCDFMLPFGIKTALGEQNNIIHIPSTYSNKEPDLYYEKTETGVYLSNNGFAKIKITNENFKKHCKMK